MLAYVYYDDANPHGAWAAYMGMGRSDPVLRGIDDVDNDRQANRIISRITKAVGSDLDATIARDLRVVVYGWLAYTFELCRQRVMDPTIDGDRVADSCAHALLDAISRMPGIPTALAEAVDDPLADANRAPRVGGARHHGLMTAVTDPWRSSAP